MIDARTLHETVTGCAAAHQRLLATVDAMTDDDARAPSLLPGWSRGHVMTHLARNADSHIHLFAVASTGEVAEQYPGGMAQRSGDIEAGAGRPIAELAADVRRTIYRLEQAWAGADEATWEGRARSPLAGEMRLSDLPFRRWRETEVHHADLAMPGFTFDDWSTGYIRRELDRETKAWASRRPMGMTTLPAAALALTPARRTAWLLGRHESEGLEKLTWA